MIAVPEGHPISCCGTLESLDGKQGEKFYMRFARNVQFQIKSEKHADFNRILTNDVLPILKKQKGFQEELTLVNRQSVMGISVWEDRASADTYASATYPGILEKLSPVLEGTPRVETYEVAASTLTS
jgi:quinol monooxygenase YgiN